MYTHIKHPVVKVLLSYLCLVLFLTVINPKKLPSAALIIPFVLFFLAIYFTVMELVSLARDERRQTVVGLRATRPRIVATLTAGFPTLLLILRSIGQLTVRDVITVGALCIVAYFYVAKFSGRAPAR